MSTCTYLVDLKSKQSVELAASGGFGVRSSQEPKALALFCHAFRGEDLKVLHEGQLEGLNLCHGELTEWTDVTCVGLYEAITGREAPDAD